MNEDIGFLKKKKIGIEKVQIGIENKKYLLQSELNQTVKSLNELEKSLRFKKFYGNIDTVDYEDLDSYDYNYDFADDDEYRKIGSTRTLFKELDRDYYKPIRTNSDFEERNDNCIYDYIRVMQIDIEIYRLKNILMRLDHI